MYRVMRSYGCKDRRQSASHLRQIMNTLVIGLGNPILSDDGVGVLVAQAVAAALGPDGKEGVTITEASVGGLRLMEMMVGYDRAFVIDAYMGGDEPPGASHRLTVADLEAVSATQHSASAHDASLVTALATGRRMGLPLPTDIVIYAIRVANVADFSCQPTPAVAAVIPSVAAAVLSDLTA